MKKAYSLGRCGARYLVLFSMAFLCEILKVLFGF